MTSVMWFKPYATMKPQLKLSRNFSQRPQLWAKDQIRTLYLWCGPSLLQYWHWWEWFILLVSCTSMGPMCLDYTSKKIIEAERLERGIFLNNLKYFLEAYSLSKICKIVLEYTLKCSQLISSSDNTKILLTTRNVRLDSGLYATKYYFYQFRFCGNNRVQLTPSFKLNFA